MSERDGIRFGTVQNHLKLNILFYFTRHLALSTYFFFIMNERCSLRTQIFDETGKHSIFPFSNLHTENRNRNVCCNLALSLTQDCNNMLCAKVWMYCLEITKLDTRSKEFVQLILTVVLAHMMSSWGLVTKGDPIKVI